MSGIYMKIRSGNKSRYKISKKIEKKNNQKNLKVKSRCEKKLKRLKKKKKKPKEIRISKSKICFSLTATEVLLFTCNLQSVRQWSGRPGFNSRSSPTKDLQNGT